MNQRPSHLILAAVAAVSLGFAGASFAGDGACGQQTTAVKSGCGSCGETTISVDKPSAEELLAQFEAVKPPAFDMTRRDDEAYVREAMQKQQEAMKERARIAEQFVELYPEHEKAPSMMMLTIRMGTGFGSPEQMAGFRQLADRYPESAEGRQARATLRQVDDLGKPFELSFSEVRTGETVSMESLRGKVVVIDFWATWCGPCVAEMPKMKSLYEKYKDEGVEFIGISLDSPEDKGGKDALLKFLDEHDIAWPNYYPGKGWESEISQSWGIQGIPAIFIIDAEGNLRDTQARSKLETLINELIAERDNNGQPRQAADQE